MVSASSFFWLGGASSLGISVDLRIYDGNKLLLIPTQPRPKPVKPTFEAFATAIVRVLSSHPQGLTWSRIHEVAGLQQRTPNPTWVYRMQRERALAEDSRWEVFAGHVDGHQPIE